MSLPPKPKNCPYCGTTVEKLTKDHIVSRSLFVQPYPDNLPTVRVCYPCNQEKGSNEDYLRDFLILNRETGSSTIARTLVDTTLTRAIHSEEHGNTSKIAHAVASQSQYVLLANPSGLIWGEAYRVPIEKERIKAVLTAMVKGFYFKTYRKILPPTHKVIAARFEPQKVPAAWDSFLLSGAKRKNLGQVFSYQYVSDHDQQITLWQFLFYQSILFQLSTHPPESTLPVITDSMF
jgi:hypothetical protein